MLSRRDFLKAGTAVGLPCSPLASAVAQALPEIESSSWCACVINCGQRCPVRCFTKKGQVIRIETDNSLPDATPSPRQLRACQRGRSMRERIYSEDRLKYPMKRVGERGEGKFERISWDEAVKLSLITGRESVINTVMMQFIGSIAPANNLSSALEELGSA